MPTRVVASGSAATSDKPVVRVVAGSGGGGQTKPVRGFPWGWLILGIFSTVLVLFYLYGTLAGEANEAKCVSPVYWFINQFSDKRINLGIIAAGGACKGVPGPFGISVQFAMMGVGALIMIGMMVLGHNGVTKHLSNVDKRGKLMFVGSLLVVLIVASIQFALVKTFTFAGTLGFMQGIVGDGKKAVAFISNVWVMRGALIVAGLMLLGTFLPNFQVKPPAPAATTTAQPTTVVKS